MAAPDPAPASVQKGQPPAPFAIVIFGASGDLTRRKLFPALHNLAVAGLLPDGFAVIGVATSPMSAEEYRERLSEQVRPFLGEAFDRARWERLLPKVSYTSGDLRDPETYTRLAGELSRVEKEHATGGNTVFYLATPPDFFAEVVRQLCAAGLVAEEKGHFRRVVVEKPFGTDLESAVALNAALSRCVREPQVYRIDHYLGKETVQNVLVFRFANGIFEPVWNRRYVDHVQITVAEDLGVEKRGGYYDHAGALRDMLPNHLFQLLTLTAMEPPISFAAEAVRDEKVKVLEAIKPLAPDDILTAAVRGQYGEGALPDGTAVPAYRSEARVAPDSPIETYAAVKVLIDSWRWADVPFYLRSGKRLARRATEIAVQFKRAPAVLFRDTTVGRPEPNLLVIRIQPEEGISVRFGAKIPGPVMRVGTVDMDFCYQDYFGATPSTGYETLLYDCAIGDATLFQRADSVEAGWRVVMPILDVWRAIPPRGFPNYPAGSWGPPEADTLLARDGRAWRIPG